MSTELVSDINPLTPEVLGTVNIVSWAGIGFALVAAGLYGVLFYKLQQLPSSQQELEALQTNAPALTRLLVVAASAALLNVVALILCLSGFLTPRRPRTMSVIGTTFSALMLIGVFSVVLVSLLISPRP
ncbi:MAG: hypothetical protein DWI22_03775 [Planctomycetota bacterium]|nr:hypothetical protein [Planctomycetales bacterium]RLT10364.1 MAG: hypothetical protein DWI22_03775 [Planctomycetota bacterium]